MENRHLKSYIIISALIMLSCTENKSTILETPFVTVVKLVSAEQSLAFEEAIHRCNTGIFKIRVRKS